MDTQERQRSPRGTGARRMACGSFAVLLGCGGTVVAPPAAEETIQAEADPEPSLLASAPPVPATKEAGRCALPARQWTVQLRLRRPRAGSLRRLRGAYPEATCSQNHAVAAVTLGTDDLRDLFGSNVRLSCRPNAGNSVNRPDYQATLARPGEVPERWRSWVSRVSLVNDPKHTFWAQTGFDCGVP